MRQGRDVIGKPVIAYTTGERLETVSDLIFDQDANLLLGFLVDEGGWFSAARVLPIRYVQAIGIDAIIVNSEESITSASNVPEIQKILERNNILKGTKIMTIDGRDLGTMVDIFFDERTGQIEGYETSGGLFADAYSGRSFIPAPDTFKIGEAVAFVPSETADLMEEQVGGLKAAMQTAGEKLQETAQATGDKIQQASRTASTTLTNKIVDPAEQRAFVLGRAAEQKIVLPTGIVLIQEGQVVTPQIVAEAEAQHQLDALYRATGGSVQDKLGERLQQTTDQLGAKMTDAVAGLTVEQTQGRRVRQLVRTSDGYVVAAPGQIVTPSVIERAKQQSLEQDLLAAVGLSTTQAAQTRTNYLAANAETSVKQGACSATEGAKNLWEQVKETAGDLQERGNQAIEDQRIKGALGHPVTRVVLDHNDGVILNVGELITHQAIAMAREAGVLDILLASVYTQTPDLVLSDLRAPQPGQAALEKRDI